MRPRVRAGVWSAALAAALLGVSTVAAGVGPVAIDALVVAKVLANAVRVPVGLTVAGGGAGSLLQLPTLGVEWAPVVSYDVKPLYATIVTKVRLPRIALGATVGFSLAAAGTVMQGFFRNPMADPSVIGVSSGAAVGAVLFIVAPVAVPLGLGLRGAAFVGALATAAVVYLIATEGGRTPVATLLLAGVAIQTFLGAVTSYLLLNSGESMRRVVYWLMGHLDATRMSEAVVTGALGLGLVGLMYLYAEDLNALLMGEEQARAVGVEVERTKRILLAASSVVTGAAVAVAGVIGFVGLIVPHAMRLLVGPDHRVLLPVSAFAGASFLVLADTVARSGAASLPVGIVTAAVGAPFFLYLLRRREVSEL
ncbi:vitamin B12 ABC transporter permease BtuC [Halosegnis marinus]|uniref:Cobalamin import system permease protein BtuC n=1 Tax=Halosegnis marinus TaxID=3034023 RepID=A0ABD5ZR35_9EURY|nr:vitamin B12 ABC transporter permease BtuC [Halosegnis sp. DT85]